MTPIPNENVCTRALAVIGMALHAVNKHEEVHRWTNDDGETLLDLHQDGCPITMEFILTEPPTKDMTAPDLFHWFCTLMWDSTSQVKFAPNGLYLRMAEGSVQVMFG